MPVMPNNTSALTGKTAAEKRFLYWSLQSNQTALGLEAELVQIAEDCRVLKIMAYRNTPAGRAEMAQIDRDLRALGKIGAALARIL